MNGFQLLGRHSNDAWVAVGKDGSRTAHEFAVDVATVARAMAGLEGPVLVYSVDRYHLTVGVVAAWHVGLSVALPPNGREQTLEQLARCVASSVGDGAEFSLDLRRCLAGERSAPARLAPIEAERLLATLHTSGTTGVQQPCDKTAGQLLGEAWSLAATFGFNPDTCVLATVPAHHIYGLLFGVLVPLSCGGCFVRETPLHSTAIEDSAQRARATTLVSVPPHLHALAHGPTVLVPSLREIFSSGAPLQPSDAEALHARLGVDVHEVLGSTETGGFAHRRAERGAERWRPLHGVGIQAAADGALLLNSPFLAPSEPQPLCCPDRIELATDGSFVHRGRSDGVVKVGGTRVSIAELVACALTLPGVRDAAAAVVDVGQARGQEVWLAVAGAPELTASQVKAHLGASHEAVTVPRRVRVVRQLPREATGKLPREALLALFDAPRGSHDVELLERRTQLDGDTCIESTRLRVPAGFAFFEGHFVGDPLLPGAAQLDSIVLTEVEHRWPELGAPRQIGKLKFKQPIRPGDELVLELRRHAAGARVDFVIRRDGAVCTQGTFTFDSERGR